MLMIVIVADYIVKELLIRIKRPNTRYTQHAKQAGCKIKVTTISVVIVVSMEFVLNHAPRPMAMGYQPGSSCAL